MIVAKIKGSAENPTIELTTEKGSAQDILLQQILSLYDDDNEKLQIECYFEQWPGGGRASQNIYTIGIVGLQPKEND